MAVSTMIGRPIPAVLVLDFVRAIGRTTPPLVGRLLTTVVSGVGMGRTLASLLTMVGCCKLNAQSVFPVGTSVGMGTAISCVTVTRTPFTVKTTVAMAERDKTGVSGLTPFP